MTATAPTLTVNDESHPWRPGLTVAELLRERRFVFPLLVISIDGEHVPRERYDTATIPEGADVRVIHLISGG
jgi:sulfur carrier protein